MKIANIRKARSWFDVLLTARTTQVATMRLESGGASGESLNTHRESDQVLLVLEGEVDAEIGGEQRHLKAGDVVIVPAGTPHRFSNAGSQTALTFNVYGPPAYPE
ncbi:MAG: cupin domain-containing protein [Myxococcaceae bacterium]